jgi:heme oxygenase
MNMLVSTAAIASASIVPAAAQADPVFALIEAHKQAEREYHECYEVLAKLDDELPDGRQKTQWQVWDDEVNIVETDDPRWIANEQRTMAAYRAKEALDLQMISTTPTSFRGAAALLAYAAELTKEDGFGGRYLDDGQSEKALGRTWEHFMFRHVAEAIADLESSSS